ncbi:hypothetical protein BaRGS_00038838 [Batillaria attramentaria]|uniref:Uncharacterized protein n=1 Tax=Batillaria attramentaria TaxID=370345 RepID=A0ABD0J5C9_9CAEN
MFFVMKLIRQCQTYIQPPIQRVIYVYHQYQPVFAQLQQECPVPMELAESLDVVQFDSTVPTLLIVDDHMDNPTMEQRVAEFFIKKCHHGNTSIAYMVQNVFHASKHHRTISLNAHYIWIGKNPRSADQILHLAMQTFPKRHHFLREAYQDATTQPYGYLFLDFKQTTPEEYRVKTHVLDETPTVYVPKVRV